MHTLSKKEFLVLGGAAILLIPALLINLDVVPLYAEEPRRAVVAMEMLFRHNWLVPTIHGDYYHLKPPFFNWILASLYTITGSYSECISPLTTVSSLLLLGLVIYFSGKRYVSKSFGALTALLFMVSAGNLFFNSLLAEIDMFYSLVTYSGLICMFHFQGRRQYYRLFLSIYFFGAIGVLTKGAPSLLYTGLSILVFFIANREFKKLFSLPHITGILLFLVIVGTYFFAYSKWGDTLFYFQNLSNESGKRFFGYSIWDYLGQILIYPFDTLKDLLPASLLLIFAVRKSFLTVVRTNPLVKFAFLMLVVHFPIYWLPPDSKQRYIISLYPFIIQVLAYFYLTFQEKEPGKSRALNLILITATGIFALINLIPLFIQKLNFIPGLTWISVLLFLTLAVIFAFQVRFKGSAFVSVILALVIMRVSFDLLILPVRAQEGKSYENKKAAEELLKIVGDNPVGVFRSSYFPMQCTYYMERQRQEILPIYRQVVPESYHVVQQILLKDYSIRRDIFMMMENPFHPVSDPFKGDDDDRFSGYHYRIIHEFDLQKRKYLLVIPITR